MTAMHTELRGTRKVKKPLLPFLRHSATYFRAFGVTDRSSLESLDPYKADAEVNDTLHSLIGHETTSKWGLQNKDQ